MFVGEYDEARGAGGVVVDANASEGNVGCWAPMGGGMVAARSAARWDARPDRPPGSGCSRGDEDSVISGIPEGKPCDRCLSGVSPVVEVGSHGVGRGMGGGVGMGAQVSDKCRVPDFPHLSGGWALTGPVVEGGGRERG